MSGWVRCIAAFTVIVIAAMYLRAGFESRAWLEQGNIERERGEQAAAIVSYRKAVSWFAPGLPYSERASEALLSIAADRSLPAPLQTAAAEEAKRGLRSSRSFIDGILGRDDALARAQAKINASVTPLDRANAIREASPPHITFWAQIAAQYMFAGWMLAALLAIWRGFESNGAIKVRSLAMYSAAWIVFFIGWLMALRAA